MLKYKSLYKLSWRFFTRIKAHAFTNSRDNDLQVSHNFKNSRDLTKISCLYKLSWLYRTLTSVADKSVILPLLSCIEKFKYIGQAWQTRIQGFASVRDYMRLTLSVSCVEEYKASLQPVSCVEEYKASLQPVSCVQTQSSLKQQSTLATKLSVAASNLKIKAAINFSHDP